MQRIYLDHNATSPLDPEVLEAMRPHWLAAGNAESRHAAGRRRGGPGKAPRSRSPGCWGPTRARSSSPRGGPRPTTWRSSAWPGRDRGPGHLVSQPDRAPGVAEPVARLEAAGLAVDRAAVDREGIADAERMAGAFRPETRLATLMLANNETGALQPVGRLAALAGRARHPRAHRRRAGRRPDPGRLPRPGGRDPGRQRPQVPRPGGRRPAAGPRGRQAPPRPLRRRPAAGPPAGDRRRAAGRRPGRRPGALAGRGRRPDRPLGRASATASRRA